MLDSASAIRLFMTALRVKPQCLVYTAQLGHYLRRKIHWQTFITATDETIRQLHAAIHLRKQLIHGARAAMRWCRKRDDRFSRWTNDLIARRGVQKANVALAHKMARLCWILLQRNEQFVLKK